MGFLAHIRAVTALRGIKFIQLFLSNLFDCLLSKKQQPFCCLGIGEKMLDSMGIL